MYRPVKTGKRGRFESLTPGIDREVGERMDRQSARLEKIAKRDQLIAQLRSENARDEAKNARDRAECRRLEAEKAAYNQAVMARKVIPVDFSPEKANKPPKKAA
ncbi:MAG TPA: hypothetical protein EYO33_03415 [Phycisphaerales bacterium]|nr:hypothetical protein [Phycisphaerales bacterium]